MNVMKCKHCNKNLIWGADHTFEDHGIEGKGIVSNFQCSKCFVDYLIYKREK